MAGSRAARTRDRMGGRRFALTKAQVRMVQAATASRGTAASGLSAQPGIHLASLYRNIGPNGNLVE